MSQNNKKRGVSSMMEDSRIANLQLVKESNKRLIFNLVYQCGPVSRASLAKITELSPTTISSLVLEMLGEDLLYEIGVGVSSTSGRKPILLEVRSEGRYVAAFEITAKGFTCSVYDIRCNKKVGRCREVEQFTGIGVRMAELLDEELSGNGIPLKKLMGISIGVPALIDKETQKILYSTILPLTEEGMDIVSPIRERFPEIPLIIENESCFYAYAEREFGLLKDVDNLIFMDISTGIGAGIILDGKVYTGAFGMAGEIGHMTVSVNGPRCKCGNLGCLEAMASIPALKEKIIFGLMSGRQSLIGDLVNGDFRKIDIGVIRKLFEMSDALVMESVQDMASILATGINNLVNLVNPQVIVLGGEVTELGDRFLDILREALHRIEFKPNISRVEICYSTLEGEQVPLGAAKYIIDKILQDESTSLFA